MSHPDALARTSQRMAVLTLLLLFVMLTLNAAIWCYPDLGSKEGGYGLDFALSNQLIPATYGVVENLPAWQRIGAILISSIPLVMLAISLLHLRQLFQHYAQGDYFSGTAATHMEKMGRAVMYWVLLNFLCLPMLSAWVTMREPAGQRFISIAFDSASVVALFVAASIMVIARILKKAATLNQENQQFV
ncbi:PEP-CTERM protein-sorting domain-containing protein [Kerstersia similis]